MERFRAVLQRVDRVRFDHFRGLSAYWSIPADAEDARSGSWQSSPGDALLTTLHNRLGGALPVIAEDLGLITAEVSALRQRHQLPGMAVLQFGFDGKPDNLHLPHNHTPDTVAYSGTHDNDTLMGWYQSLDTTTREQLEKSLKLSPPPPALHWQLIDTLLASPSETVILPLQDLLGLDSDGRMNTPGTTTGNWGWRAPPEALDAGLAATVRERLQHHQRL
jgi:4-alpha-glucanotransferase